MSSLISRNGVLYAKLKDIDGEWRRVKTPFIAGQEREAEAWVLKQEAHIAAVRAGLVPAIADDLLTLTGWVESWGTERRELEVDGNNDAARLRNHVLPRIGHLPIASIEAKHLVDVISELRKTKIKTVRGLETPAPRTVYNVYSALCATFRDAVLAGKVKVSPCVLTEHQLGVKVDKDREWRATAVFTKAEAQTIISTSKIPWDRRVGYSIELLAGVRPGESAALRWRHYDPSNRPLGELLVALSFNSKRGAIKGTKTDTVKHVPVHPTLAAILGEWKLSGWAEMMGRMPTPDDLIVPLPPADAAARVKRRDAEPFRTDYYTGRRWREEDMPALGWRHRRHYDMRATFVTLALDDGADEHILETRVTHTKQARGAFKLYNRGKQWHLTCAEIVKLNLVRVPEGELGAERSVVAVGGPTELGPSVVQAGILSAMSSSSGLRRRGSNPLRVVRGAEPLLPDQQVGSGPDEPSDIGERVLDQALVQGPKSACDLGMALLIASASEE